MPITIHTPSALLGAGVLALAFLVGASSQQATKIGGTAPSHDVKILGIPAPDEWVNIESNPVGQPPQTFTVPHGHRLTLVEMFTTSPVLDPSLRKLDYTLLIDGSPLGTGRFVTSSVPEVVNPDAGSQSPRAFRAGAVLRAGQVLTISRDDLGTSYIPNPDYFASNAQTFTVRGFLERVR